MISFNKNVFTITSTVIYLTYDVIMDNNSLVTWQKFNVTSIGNYILKA